MALNPYFSSRVKSEINLYEDLVIEAIKMYGVDVKYLPRTVIGEDKLLNEDLLSKFDSAYTVEVYIETVDGFDGDGRLFSKFGLEIREQATFVVAKRRWSRQVGVWKEGMNPQRPSEGDLIYIPMTKAMFEVKFVEHESPFFQLQNVPCYKLQCEMFEYSNEKFSTGDVAVDSTENDNAFTVAMEIDLVEGVLSAGDEITQLSTDGGTVLGKVMKKEERGARTVYHVGSISSSDTKVRGFVENSVIISGTISGTVSKIYTLSDTDNLTAVNDPIEQNHELQKRAADIVDFSEDNPFAE